MADITKEEMRERLGNIDQIRDIIFGSQLRDYNGRFDKIESELSMLQQDVQDRVEQLRMVLSTELRASLDAIEKKFKTLSVNTQTETADLQQQLDRLNKKFTTSVESLDEAIDKQTLSIRDEFSQSRDKIQEDIRSLKTMVFEELDRRFSLLKEVKVSRDDMAEILFELGMRLKGTEFVPELKEVANTNAGFLPEHY